MNAAPLAYHITWTTYGTWLPGDERGWVKRDGGGIQNPDPESEVRAWSAMRSEPVVLDARQREVVARTVQDHCRHRGWMLHAANARTNHVHVVVTAAVPPERVLEQLKAWCSRRLNAETPDPPAKWWTYHGSTKYIWDDRYFDEAVGYVLERQ